MFSLPSLLSTWTIIMMILIEIWKSLHVPASHLYNSGPTIQDKNDKLQIKMQLMLFCFLFSAFYSECLLIRQVSKTNNNQPVQTPLWRGIILSPLHIKQLHRGIIEVLFEADANFNTWWHSWFPEAWPHVEHQHIFDIICWVWKYFFGLWKKNVSYWQLLKIYLRVEAAQK